MTRMQFGAALGFGVLVLAANHAFAESNCASRDLVIARLAERFGESRRAIGLASNNQVMEVFASDDSGSWTITVTLPNGLTCLVASGLAFEAVTETIAPASRDDA